MVNLKREFEVAFNMFSRMRVHLFCRSSSNIIYKEMDTGENNGILGRHHKNCAVERTKIVTLGMYYKCS
jgi:hypothetical protein